MHILATTTLQHEDGMYLAETCSCVNKENSWARLEIVTVRNQCWLPTFTIRNNSYADVNKTYLLSCILFDRHPRVSNVLRSYWFLAYEHAQSATMLVNCDAQSLIVHEWSCIYMYIYHTVTEDVNWIIVTEYGSRTLYLTTGCIIVPLCLMGWLHKFKFWSFVCSDHTG
jgi:hypothetical protein